MKKVAIVAAMLTLAGCVQVDNYQEVIKHPVPSQLAGYWQSKGPQSAMVSPEAIATLVVTPEGDTLDCRQWQRVIAVPGKIMLRSDDYYNVTRSWMSIRWSVMGRRWSMTVWNCTRLTVQRWNAQIT
ncbi:FIG00640199: hypothetical protein [Enterobacter hormaechei]|nr:FIG00640199: hypothetical protein [Enterobacter hormaechei]